MLTFLFSYLKVVRLYYIESVRPLFLVQRNQHQAVRSRMSCYIAAYKRLQMTSFGIVKV